MLTQHKVRALVYTPLRFPKVQIPSKKTGGHDLSGLNPAGVKALVCSVKLQSEPRFFTRKGLKSISDQCIFLSAAHFCPWTDTRSPRIYIPQIYVRPGETYQQQKCAGLKLSQHPLCPSDEVMCDD